MALLLTQTLIGAWSYAMDAHESAKEDAWGEFMKTLHRIPRESTPELENGILFENEVYSCAAGCERNEHPVWENGIRKVADIVRGSAVQVRLSRPLRAAEEDLLLYGVLDAMKCGTIYDVKFSNRSFGSVDLAGKYMESPQHPAYLYLAPEARDFQYLVSDGEDLYTERYDRKNTRHIGEIAAEFIGFLRAADLMDIYREKWVTQR